VTLEDQNTDRKSLRAVTGRTADWDDVARACVCFANGSGGRMLIGIEDGETLPPPAQVVPPELLDRLRRRIGELTVNVQALPSVRRALNGGEFIDLVVDRSPSVASTRDGRYFLRVGDTCQPVLGDDVLRLANERPGRPWEAMDSGVPRGAADADKALRRARESCAGASDLDDGWAGRNFWGVRRKSILGTKWASLDFHGEMGSGIGN